LNESLNPNTAKIFKIKCLIMWGNISTEANYLVNFNLGFSNNTSDVLIHLAQWQYWWWFWFSFLWVLYYLIIAKTVRHRILKFRPRLATTFRPHGKWGDLLTCIIPSTWCINILINSNFILKLLEWQNEASLFTVRIRGRQWYWVYKFELKTFTDVLSAPKNVGHNHWQINTPNDVQKADDYLKILRLRAQNRWLKAYWDDSFRKGTKVAKNHNISTREQFKIKNDYLWENILLNEKVRSLRPTDFKLELVGLSWLDETYNYITDNFINKKVIDSPDINYFTRLKLRKKNYENRRANIEQSINFFMSDEDWKSFFSQEFTLKRKTQNYLTKKFWVNEFTNTNKSNLFRFSDFFENSRSVKRSSGAHNPLRMIKNTFLTGNAVYDNMFDERFELLRFRFNDNNISITPKNNNNNQYLTLKQKRYSLKGKISSRALEFFDYELGKKKKVNWAPSLQNNKYFDDSNRILTGDYRLIKKNRTRQEVYSVHLNRRLLRTKRTLVLPAHVNLTAITNSYDVVHSWFIPGLGLKFDCIPGRSTHHTFFVENVGFYYGQCAEICGRYHHHMPIRVCALPFEHFLVWWNSFGLPKLLFTNSQKKLSNIYGFRKYVW
jgi:heme/copper-type cytochrome/quinol oxidase subunit 2